MTWWIWAAVGVMAAILMIDWLIVMGKDPRGWKGGKKDE
jgi:hypothetical protein